MSAGTVANHGDEIEEEYFPKREMRVGMGNT
jgi:hypothetical protein